MTFVKWIIHKYVLFAHKPYVALYNSEHLYLDFRQFFRKFAPTDTACAGSRGPAHRQPGQGRPPPRAGSPRRG